MNPFGHLLLGIIFAAVLLVMFPEIGFAEAAIIVASTVLIDVDHYIFYVSRKKNFSLIKAYKWYTENIRRTRHLKRKEKKQISFGFHFLHGIEILVLIYLVYFYIHPLFLFVLIGISLHLFADLIVEFIECARIDKISVIYGLHSHRKLKFIDDLNLPLPEASPVRFAFLARR